MNSIEIITLPVTDQQKAKEFYLKLGFQLLVEAPADHGQTWVQLGFPNQKTSLALLTFPGIIFETPDIEKEIESLTANGIKVGPIDHKPWGKFAWLKDLDGNSLCLHQK